MHELLCEYFEGVTLAQFRQDLAEKNWVLLIERGKRIVGFTTLLAYETSFEGKPISVVYSGDTLVAPEAWNTSTLPRAWIESVAMLRSHYPRGQYLWLLIASGFRTYRFLPLFWREFHPRYDAPASDRWKQLMNHLAAEKFGPQYDPAAGIVRLGHPQRLRPTLAAVPPGRREDEHVAFFIRQNPGHAQGDELVCLTELSPANLTSAGRRMAAATPQW
jgi:hypothetical protein